MIAARGLTKRYGRTVLVRDLSFAFTNGIRSLDTLPMLLGSSNRPA